MDEISGNTGTPGEKFFTKISCGAGSWGAAGSGEGSIVRQRDHELEILAGPRFDETFRHLPVRRAVGVLGGRESAAEWQETRLRHLVEAAELRERFGMIVDPEIEAPVGLRSLDAERRRLLARLSPPAASPASMAASSRSTNGRSGLDAKASQVRSTTSGPASMLPATDIPGTTRWPAQPTQPEPVNAAVRPWRSMRCSWRISIPGSDLTSMSRTVSAS